VRDVLASLRRAEDRAGSVPVGVRINAALYLLALLALAVVTLEVRRGHPESAARQVRSLPRPVEPVAAAPARTPEPAVESAVPAPEPDAVAAAPPTEADVTETAPGRQSVGVVAGPAAPDPAAVSTAVASPAPVSPPSQPLQPSQPARPHWQPPQTTGAPAFGSPLPDGWRVAGPVRPAAPEPLVIPPLRFQPLQPLSLFPSS
jgi:hypothetical protein